jgi:hypothetical protein
MTRHPEPRLTAERQRWSCVASSVAGHASPLAESCYCVRQGEQPCHPERQRGIWVASSGAWTWVLARYAERVVSRPSSVAPRGLPIISNHTRTAAHSPRRSRSGRSRMFSVIPNVIDPCAFTDLASFETQRPSGFSLIRNDPRDGTRIRDDRASRISVAPVTARICAIIDIA